MKRKIVYFVRSKEIFRDIFFPEQALKTKKGNQSLSEISSVKICK